MPGPGPRLANAFLRYSTPFSRFRNIPALGSLLQLTSSAVVGNDSLLWVQIEHGPAAGLWISLNPRTGKSVLLGEGEPRVQQALAEYLRPGMLFYDLGANIGFFSLFASRLVGDEGHVFSFEPDPILFLRLRQNLEHNGFRQAIAEERAVWNQSATLPFTCADTSESADRALGHVSLEPTEPPNSIPVACVTLDDYCTTHPAPSSAATCRAPNAKSSRAPPTPCVNGIPSSSARCTAWKTTSPLRASSSTSATPATPST